MSATAGWYLDPSGVPGQLRWWDGARWTDHVTPDPSAVPAAAGAPGGLDAHAGGAAADDPEPTQPPPPTGTPDPEPASGGGSGGAWGSGDTSRPAWQVDTPVPTSGTSVRTGLIVAAVVGVVVLGAVALLVAGVFWTGPVTFGEFDDEMYVEEWGWDGEVVDGGRLLVGDTVRVELPDESTFEVTIDIVEPGTYVFDVHGDGDFDGMLEVHGPDEDLLSENDDRGDQVVDRIGGDSLDPFLELELTPGAHRVLVQGWAGDGGPFDLTVGRR